MGRDLKCLAYALGSATEVFFWRHTFHVPKSISRKSPAAGERRDPSRVITPIVRDTSGFFDRTSDNERMLILWSGQLWQH